MTRPRRAAELRLAVLLLTRLPAGRLAAPAPSIAAAAWAFPLAGVAVGLVAGAVHAAATLVGMPPALAAVLAVGAAVAVTGGLHEDGLADLADGFGGGRDRARKLAIMRDSRIGAYGVLALILAMAARLAAVAGLGAGAPVAAMFVATAATSRAALPALMRLVPPARADGLGHAASRPPAGGVLAAALIGVVAALPLGVAGLATVVAAALGAGAVALLALRQIGGQTGDVLGAAQVVAEVAGWLVLAALFAG